MKLKKSSAEVKKVLDIVIRLLLTKINFAAKLIFD